MKKLLSISLLLGLFIFLPGCSCDREDIEGAEVIEPEVAPVHLQEDFVGPTTEPFSNGPSEMPPTE
jgi:hypothetical protein